MSTPRIRYWHNSQLYSCESQDKPFMHFANTPEDAYMKWRKGLTYEDMVVEYLNRNSVSTKFKKWLNKVWAYLFK